MLLVVTANVPMHQLDDDVQALFAKFAFHDCDRELTHAQRRRFWQQMDEHMLSGRATDRAPSTSTPRCPSPICRRRET